MEKIAEGVFLILEEMPHLPGSFELYNLPGAQFSPFKKHELDIAASYLLAFSWKYGKWVAVDARTFFAPLTEVTSGGDDEVARLAAIGRKLPISYIIDSIRELQRRGLVRIERIGGEDIVFPTAALVSAVR